MGSVEDAVAGTAAGTSPGRTIESIGSSTRIEGVKLTDRQIETLLANLQRHAFKSRDEQEVAGYAEAMDLLFQSWEELTLTENHLKQLHAVLLSFSAKAEYHRGQYKRTPNNVVAYDPDGKEIGVVFETTSPFKTPLEMQQLVEWTNQALTERLLHRIFFQSTRYPDTRQALRVFYPDYDHSEVDVPLENRHAWWQIQAEDGEWHYYLDEWQAQEPPDQQ